VSQGVANPSGSPFLHVVPKGPFFVYSSVYFFNSGLKQFLHFYTHLIFIAEQNKLSVLSHESFNLLNLFPSQLLAIFKLWLDISSSQAVCRLFMKSVERCRDDCSLEQ
jgi:hypothetical protein